MSELVKVAESDEKIGIVGPKIYYYDYNGRSDMINFTGADLILWRGTEKRYGFNEVDRGQWDRIMSVDKIEGSCMLIKKEILEKVGFFDEKFSVTGKRQICVLGQNIPGITCSMYQPQGHGIK